MISRRFKWLGQVFKNTGSRMRNGRGFPMHQLWRPHNLAAKDLADALVTKTNPEQRNLGSKIANDVAADSGVARLARSGGNANSCRTQSLNVLLCHFVVAFHHNMSAEFTENLRQVIGE